MSTLRVDEALALTVGNAGRQATAAAALEHSCGRVLAQDVVADVDSPPFAKALMDGYAVRSEDLLSRQAELTVHGEVTAGTRAQRAVAPGSCYRIMTGAPIPDGADSVVIIERSTSVAAQRVHLVDPDFRPGQHVMARGTEFRAGDVVLRSGARLRPNEIGLLAGVGCTRPSVATMPTVAIATTGDELVAASERPVEAQIRNTNGPMLVAMVQASGAQAVDLGLIPDDEASLSTTLARGLDADILLITGGVSAGVKDLVPAVLARLGVSRIFHGVNLKPGKPVWFGVQERSGKLVFGLPGNPVSVFVCFHLFVATAIRAREGETKCLPVFEAAIAADALSHGGARETFHPARVRIDGQRPLVEPVAWGGSADLRALVDANVLMRLPAGTPLIAAGDWINVIRLG